MDTHLQEQPEESGELHICQPDLVAGKGQGADHLECHHTAHEGKPHVHGEQAQPVWVWEMQCLLYQHDVLLYQDDLRTEQENAVDIFPLDFSN